MYHWIPSNKDRFFTLSNLRCFTLSLFIRGRTNVIVSAGDVMLKLKCRVAKDLPGLYLDVLVT